MNDIIEEAKALREDIDSLPEVKEYYRLKSLFENDICLKQMRENIARLKSEGKEMERNNLLAVYNSHPLVNNYYAAKEEVERILLVIKNIIQ